MKPTDWPLSGIRIVVFDVDGVLTDGSLHIGAQGEHVKVFNAKDGVAVALLRQIGIATGVLSGKASAALDFRLAQLGIETSITGRSDKLRAFGEMASALGLEPSEMAYVGDDVLDLPLTGVCHTFFAPSDAHPLVLESADIVTTARGGRGVAREVAELVAEGAGGDLRSLYDAMTSHDSGDMVQ